MEEKSTETTALKENYSREKGRYGMIRLDFACPEGDHLVCPYCGEKLDENHHHELISLVDFEKITDQFKKQNPEVAKHVHSSECNNGHNCDANEVKPHHLEKITKCSSCGNTLALNVDVAKLSLWVSKEKQKISDITKRFGVLNHKIKVSSKYLSRMKKKIEILNFLYNLNLKSFYLDQLDTMKRFTRILPTVFDYATLESNRKLLKEYKDDPLNIPPFFEYKPSMFKAMSYFWNKGNMQVYNNRQLKELGEIYRTYMKENLKPRLEVFDLKQEEGTDHYAITMEVFHKIDTLEQQYAGMRKLIELQVLVSVLQNFVGDCSYKISCKMENVDDLMVSTQPKYFFSNSFTSYLDLEEITLSQGMEASAKKLISLDLDGTMCVVDPITKKKGIPLDTLAYLKSLEEQNRAKVVFNSGRTADALYFMDKDLTLKNLSASYNGSAVSFTAYKDHQLKLFAQKALAELELEEHEKVTFKKLHQLASVQGPLEVGLSTDSLWTVFEYVVRVLYNLPISRFRKEPQFQAICTLSKEELTATLKQLIEKNETIRFIDEAVGGLEVTEMAKGMFSISGPVSKGTAIDLITKGLGLTKDDVMHMGDGDNDAPMIDYTKLCVGMPVSNPKYLEKLKKAPNGYILNAYREDGTYKTHLEMVKEVVQLFLKQK